MVDAVTSNSQDQPVVDNDVEMAGTNGEDKTDVKLEDLFADVDDDEEWPTEANNNLKSASPSAAPLSPVYGVFLVYLSLL